MESNKYAQHARKTVKRLLESSGETQAEFAAQIGVAPSLVSMWLSGTKESMINSKNLMKVANHFGVSADFLLGVDHTTSQAESAETLNTIESRPKLRILFKKLKNADDECIDKFNDIADRWVTKGK